MRFLRTTADSYHSMIGVGGVGTGCLFALEGNHTLGRNESRPAQLLDVRDYCKLHIVSHYVARLLGAGHGEKAFRIVPIAKVGDDSAGQSLIHQMREVGIDTTFVTQVPGKPTLSSVCFQYPDGSGGNLTTSNSAAAELCEQELDAASQWLRNDGQGAIAVAVPEVPLGARRYLLSLATRAGGFRVASFVAAEIPSALQNGMFGMLDLAALNETEATEFVGHPFSESDREAFVSACLGRITDCFPGLRLVVSAGKLGAYGFERGAWSFCAAPAVRAASTAGAGDALLAGVISSLAAGAPFIQSAPRNSKTISTALDFGVLLASYTVTSPHTIHPNASLDTLIPFAQDLGLSFAPEFARMFAQG